MRCVFVKLSLAFAALIALIAIACGICPFVALADEEAGTARAQDSVASGAAGAVMPVAISQTKAPSTGASGETWERLWGTEAFDTMREVVQEGWNSSNAVVIATAANYMDALSASSLAGYLKAPVLLTNAQSLPSQTSAEIGRLKARVAYIVGGTKAISSSVEAQIRQAGCSEVVRIWGEYAQDTAVAVANHLAGKRSSTAIVATDVSYQDALSIAPYSYKTASPIYLTSGRGSTLGPAVRSSIANGGYSRVVVVGGPVAVKESVTAQLNSIGASNIVRLWGQNAEGTSSEVANWCMSQGMTAGNVGVATSTDYRDALVGSALCGKNGSPIVLASARNRSVVYSFLNSVRSKVSKGYIFGGNSVVSAATSDVVVKGTGKTVYSNFSGYNVNGFTKVGVDVSFWQAGIDWNKVKAAGVDFAIVRAGYGSDYASQDDRYFLRNVEGAKAAGIELGVYLFSYAQNTSMAKSEAAHVIRLLKTAGLTSSDLPFGVYYDLEWSNMESTSNRTLLLNMTRAFASEVKNAGYKMGVYANLNWWRNYLPSSEYGQWNRWVAQYNSECTYFGSYCMWQFRSNGSVPGINGNADLNLFYL